MAILTNGDIMKFILSFSMDSAAFDGSDTAAEVARILTGIALKIEQNNTVPSMFENIRDVNGNIIGTFAAKPNDYK